MITLALDTSGRTGGVAILDGPNILGEITLSVRETHCHSLFTSMEWLLKKTGQGWSNLDLIAVAIGPGSFTGLRIGLATAKGIAFAHNLPICGVPSLDALASQIMAAPGDIICPVIDARKNQVFTATFKARIFPEDHERISEYMVIDPEDLSAKITGKGKVIFFGTGFDKYRDRIIKSISTPWVTAPAHLSVARASSTGSIAVSRMMSGSMADDPALLAPVYVRASEAELTRRRKRASTLHKSP